MFFRHPVSWKLLQYISSYKKELILLLLIFFSLGTGWYETNFGSKDTRRIWQVRDTTDVKGAHAVSYPEQFRELEIIPAKTPRVTKPVKEKPKARQIDETTWTMDVKQGEKMATASEIISALNTYRASKGRGSLSFDQKLANYAQGRADYFSSRGSMDSHAGFQDFISNQNGFMIIGFYALGENSSFGYQLDGTNLIEVVFAGDAPHDTNQLNPEWSHVGVGVNGQAVDIIFGGRKQ